MVSLYDITDELQRLESLLDDPEIPAEAVHDALEQMNMTLGDKVDAYCMIIKDAEAAERMIIDERKRLDERKRVFQNRASKLRHALGFALGKLNKPSVETARFKAYLQSPPERAYVEDESVLPDEFFTRKPSLSAIKEALKAGKEVPGAKLIRDDKRVAIR